MVEQANNSKSSIVAIEGKETGAVKSSYWCGGGSYCCTSYNDASKTDGSQLNDLGLPSKKQDLKKH